MKEHINYLLLDKAINHFKLRGYNHIEVPWIVPHKFKNVTWDHPCYNSVDNNDNYLVGSAEQSFLYLDFIGNLKPDKYVACTPCFRKNDGTDNTHNPYFMKVELYNNVTVSDFHLNVMLGQAKNFFLTLTKQSDTVEIVKTSNGYDIEVNGIEVGSYGIGDYNSKKWLYGTAIAEPRFSHAVGQKSFSLYDKRENHLNLKDEG